MYEQANPEENVERHMLCELGLLASGENHRCRALCCFPWQHVSVHSLYKHQTEGDSDTEKQTHASKSSLGL